MDAALAYFITFRTYGTWLHGDARGSVDRRQRAFGQEPLPESHAWRGYEGGLLRRPAVILTDASRSVLESAFREACITHGWALSAVNVRTNHVHMVVTATQSPEFVMQRLKAEGTKALRRAGIAMAGQPVWARHGSTRYLWTEKDVEGACDYVVDGQ